SWFLGFGSWDFGFRSGFAPADQVIHPEIDRGPLAAVAAPDLHALGIAEVAALLTVGESDVADRGHRFFRQTPPAADFLALVANAVAVLRIALVLRVEAVAQRLPHGGRVLRRIRVDTVGATALVDDVAVRIALQGRRRDRQREFRDFQERLR